MAPCGGADHPLRAAVTAGRDALSRNSGTHLGRAWRAAAHGICCVQRACCRAALRRGAVFAAGAGVRRSGAARGPGREAFMAHSAERAARRRGKSSAASDPGELFLPCTAVGRLRRTHGKPVEMGARARRLCDPLRGGHGSLPVAEGRGAADELYHAGTVGFGLWCDAATGELRIRRADGERVCRDGAASERSEESFAAERTGRICLGACGARGSAFPASGGNLAVCSGNFRHILCRYSDCDTSPCRPQKT